MEKLDLRWDVPLKRFGKEFEEIQPGEVKFSREDEILGVLLTSEGVVDAFDVAFGNIHEIWFDDLNKIKQTVDFHFEGRSYENIGEDMKRFNCFTVEGGLKLVYIPKLLSSAKAKNHIHNMKYLYEGEVVNIRVYCPFKYSEATTFLDQWYEKLKKLRSAKRKER